MNTNALRLAEMDKCDLGLSWAEMDALGGFLREGFGIDLIPMGADFFATIRARCGDEIADEYEALNMMRGSLTGCMFQKADRRFYDMIAANKTILGLTHSQKWPQILDTAAYATALYRAACLDGAVVDVGCHAGYVAMWLARALGCSCSGFDRSAAAIRLAREAKKRLQLSVESCRFDVVRYPEEAPSGPFSLLVSSDGPVAFTAMSLQRAVDMLAPEGLILWTGSDVGIGDAHTALERVGLSMLLADVLGGWTGEGYESNVVFVLARGPEPRVPPDMESRIVSIWDSGFRDYANTPGRPWNEKTVGYYRTWQRFGPRPT